METCARRRFLSDGDLDDSAETVLEGSLHLLGACPGATCGHDSCSGTSRGKRAKEDEGGGWRLEANKSGHKSLSEASKEALCGLVGSPDCTTVEEEGCQIYGVVHGSSVRASSRDGSIEAKGEEEWA